MSKNSANFKFTAEMFKQQPADFLSGGFFSDEEAEGVANCANALLDAHLATLPVVYCGHPEGYLVGDSQIDVRGCYRKWTARLFNIEEWTEK